MKKLVLIDGTNLLHRAFYAAQNTPGDNQVNKALNIYSNFLRAIKNKENPDYGYVAWDAQSGKHTIRGEVSDNYKANRKSSPIPAMCYTLAELITMCYGFAYGSSLKYEADDIIGTLAHRAAKENIKTVIYTNDRDMLQLVNEKNVVVKILKSGVSQVTEFDAEMLEKKYQIKPKQFVDYKALVGDKSDNYPGVKGIGPKTAVKLLKKYKNLDDIYTHINELKDKNRKLLEQNKRAEQVSYDLALIRKNVETFSAQSIDALPVLDTDEIKLKMILNYKK